MSEEKIILMTKNLTKSFDGVRAVDNVSTYFLNGRIYAIIGPNGAGKTTFFNLLNGFFPPDRGEIYYNDKNITRIPAWERAKEGIGRLFQDIRVFPNLTAEENLLCFEENPYGRDPFKILFNLQKTKNINEKQKEKAREILDKFKINPNNFVQNLSYGQQKLVALGRVLITNSKLLLLDEPFAGIHPKFRRMIRDFLIEYVEKGNTVLIIEHDISFIKDFVEWAYLFVGGKRVTFGKIEEIMRSEEVIKGIWGI